MRYLKILSLKMLLNHLIILIKIYISTYSLHQTSICISSYFFAFKNIFLLFKPKLYFLFFYFLTPKSVFSSFLPKNVYNYFLIIYTKIIIYVLYFLTSCPPKRYIFVMLFFWLGFTSHQHCEKGIYFLLFFLKKTVQNLTDLIIEYQ